MEGKVCDVSEEMGGTLLFDRISLDFDVISLVWARMLVFYYFLASLRSCFPHF